MEMYNIQDIIGQIQNPYHGLLVDVVYQNPHLSYYRISRILLYFGISAKETTISSIIKSEEIPIKVREEIYKRRELNAPSKKEGALPFVFFIGDRHYFFSGKNPNESQDFVDRDDGIEMPLSMLLGEVPIPSKKRTVSISKKKQIETPMTRLAFPLKFRDRVAEEPNSLTDFIEKLVMKYLDGDVYSLRLFCKDNRMESTVVNNYFHHPHIGTMGDKVFCELQDRLNISRIIGNAIGGKTRRGEQSESLGEVILREVDGYYGSLYESGHLKLEYRDKKRKNKKRL